jgi:thiamine kinase-like enzyme
VQLPARFSVPELLEDYAAIAQARGASLPASYDDARAAARRIVAALGHGSERPCHNDLLAGNLIRADEDGRTLLVDWEYAGMGDPRFDLGNLSVNNDFDDGTDDRLLATYQGSAASDGQRAALKLMRVMSDAREAAWGVVQGAVSDLDFDFEGYAAEHFQRLRAAVEQPLFEEWIACAATESGGQGGQTA